MMDPIDMVSSDSSYASDVSEDGSATELIKKPKYKCKYCSKRYSKTQALGGHQNAHKREKEITERQKRAIVAHINQPDPYMFPNHYALPPGFEQPCYKVDEPDSLTMVCNQCTGSSSSGFARLQIDPSQEMEQGWAITENPYQPLLSAPSSVSLDLCLGVGSSSQAQTRPKEPNDATKVAADKKDDDHSLSLLLKL